jgi:hypothetical protein
MHAAFPTMRNRLTPLGVLRAHPRSGDIRPVRF